MVDLNINLVAKMAGAGAGGAAGGVAGAAGAGLAGRAGGVMAAGLMGGAGSRTEMIGKGLGQISKQLPGAGMLGDMAGAFKSGGIVGVGMAGVAGIMGFVKQIMESSKVFQGIAGSFFKIFGAMADVFLLPFLPIAMRGMQMLMQHLPKFGEWGEKAAQGVDNIIQTFKDKGFLGGILHYLKSAWEFISVDVKNWISETLIPVLARAVVHIGGAVGQTIKNLIKGKESGKIGGEGEGAGRTLQQRTGSREITAPGFFPMIGKKAMNLAFQRSEYDPSARNPLGIKPFDTRSGLEFGDRGAPMSPGMQSELQALSDQGVSEQDIINFYSQGSNIQGPRMPSQRPIGKKQMGGTIRSYQPGGEVPGSPGQGIHVMLHGGEGIIPAGNMALAKATKGDALDILIGAEGDLQTIAAGVVELKLRGRNDRLNPRSAANQLKNEGVKEILPQTLENVDIFYHELGDMTARIQNNTWGAGRGILSGASTFAADADAKTKDGVNPRVKTPDNAWAYYDPKRFEGTVLEGLGDPYALSSDTMKQLEQTIKDIQNLGIDKVLEKEIEERKQPGYKADLTTQGGMFFDSSDPDDGGHIMETDMQRIARNIQTDQGLGIGSGVYFADLDTEGEGRTPEQVAQDRKNSLAAIERRKQKAIEAKRLADSLTAARAAIYGPEGGINAAGEFVHGGLLTRTSDSEAMRIKTFDEVNLTDQQRADLAASGPGAYDFLNVGTTTIKTPAPKTEAIYDEEQKKYVRPSGEIMELAKRMAAQLNYIASFQPLITAAWRLQSQGLEGGRGQPQSGTEAQRLIRKRSQAEEAHTRMINQSVQDRLPYSLQEFQTRFPDEFPETDKGYGVGGFAAGGIVPGDIGESQIVMAHGGEQISPVGMSGGRRGHTSNRVMNISINNASSVRDILRDLNDMESMDDASFFNSVT